MKIRQKLILGFVGIASLVGVVGIICINVSQKALQKSIGESSVTLADETMDKIDRNIYYIIKEFQGFCSDLILKETIAKSNQEFEELENLQKYIYEQNNEWISAEKGTTTPLMRELLNNKLSEELREKIRFHKEKYGYNVFVEASVTNKYGANAALTEKTSDYRQDDELWWENAREDGLYVSDVEYDESSGIHSTVIAIRSDDEEGNFNGVVKAVLNIEETLNIIRKTKETIKYNNAKFKLLDRNGRTIFNESGESKFLEDISNRDFFKEIAGDNGYLQKKAEDQQEGKTELLAFARSRGYNDYEGLGWILTIEYRTAELFAPVVQLRNIMLSTSLMLTILAVIPGLLISNHISKPLSKLKIAMDKIGKGDMGIHVDIKRNDEIGQLANAFNQMVEHRKQAEAALRISEGKLDAMLRAIADDIAVIDNDLNIIWTNDVARKIFGDDIVGRKCYEVYHQRNEPCEPYPCPTLQAFQDGNIHQYESQITGKDGKKRYIHTIANVALRDEDGKPTGVLEICRDITERKRMEEALRESEEKYKNLFEHMSSGVAVYQAIDNGNDFVIRDFNQTAEKIENVNRENIIGKRATEVFSGINEFGLLDVFKRVWETGKTKYFPDALYMDKSGRRSWRENRVYRLPTGEVVAVYNDITERKQTEEDLRVSERKYSDLVQQSPDAVISLDKFGHFLSFNPAAERISGFYAQELIGKHFSKVGILDKKSIPKALKEFALTLTGAERQPFDLVITRKDKSCIHMEANGRLIKQKGQNTWVQVTLRDITERRLAEQELEKLNKDLESAVWELRRANKEVQEFAYITAHDLKTPLRGIGTLANWISTDYADKFDEQGKQQVSLLVEKTKQMNALIDDILQYSRLGHSSPDKKPVNLNTVLSEVISSVDPPENIHITIENELPVLICEKTQIMQVFQNLLGNAVKYMDKPEGQIKVGCVEQDDFWKFSVADNGPGIDEKYHKKIFKIFQTLTSQNRKDSTGIGLSIVQKIVELNAGIVWVESEPGKGSTFFFTLPKSSIRRKVSDESTAEQA
ncbi:MAG: PAS domain S-box protein [Sedimentisphaerales bacterium]|nr:PAS domain S-box protein [Sedimentisphaerales bacterium]